MKLRFFTIPMIGGELASEALNRFLSWHRVVHVDRSFVDDGSGSTWAICVSYLDGEGRPGVAKGESKSRIDYRDVLSTSDFVVYCKLRDLRKAIADRNGVPAFALFNNDQLAAMVQTRTRSLKALGRIEGVGTGRIEKYGPPFLEILTEAFGPADSENVGPTVGEVEPPVPENGAPA